MHTIEEMQDDMKNAEFTMSVIYVTEDHMSISVYGGKSRIDAFVSFVGKFSNIKRDVIIDECKRMNLRVRADADGYDLKGVTAALRFNKVAKSNNINAEKNWDVVFGYIKNPQINLINIPEKDLGDFWEYADYILYNQMLPLIKGS